MTRQETGRLIIFIIAVVTFGLVAAGPVSAQWQGAGAWSSSFSQGRQEISTRNASGEFTISCDAGNSPDHSGTHIRVSIGGRTPQPNSDVILEIDGYAIVMQADESGRVTIGDCPDCAERFRDLWNLLRQGRRLQVFGGQTGRAQFSLRGSSRVMPLQPCPVNTASTGESPETPARPVSANCIPLRMGGPGQTEVVGMARPERGVCYALETSRGQIAQLEILDGPNIAITVPGIADAQERLEFDTEGGPYEIRVIQVERAGRASRYRLRVVMREGSLDNDTGRSSLAEEFASRQSGDGSAGPGEATSSQGTRSAQVTLPILGKDFDLTISYGADEPAVRDPQEAVRYFPADLRAGGGKVVPDDEILGVVEERAWAAQLQFDGVFKALLQEQMKDRPQDQANAAEEDLLGAFREGSGARYSEDGQHFYDEQLALSLVVRALRRALGHAEAPVGGGFFTVPDLPAELREAYTRQGFDPDEAFRGYRRLRAAYRVADFGLLDRAIAYPLIVIDEGPGMTVANLQELLGADLLVMNQGLRDIVLGQDFADLFVRDQGAMFGNGELWMTPACASGDCARRLALRTINLGGLKPLQPVSLPEPPATALAPAVTGEGQADTSAPAAPAAPDTAAAPTMTPAAPDDDEWEEAGERLKAQILNTARDFCRSVHNTAGSLLPDAIKSVPNGEGTPPDLVVSFRGIQCAGVDNAPLKQGGFCGLTRDGMKCHVEVYGYKDGEYTETRSYLE